MTEGQESEPAEVFNFDFNDVRAVTVDDRVGATANYYLQRALEITAQPDVTPRERALAALAAARHVLDELAPTISAPIASLESELRDLNAGAPNGPITLRETKPKGGRTRLPEEKIRSRARFVLALGWLQRIGKPRPTRKQAATKIADALGGRFKDHRRIEQFRDDFTKEDAHRERQALNDLWFELEVERGIDIDHATEDDVIAWVKSAD